MSLPISALKIQTSGSRYRLIEAIRGAASVWVALFHGIGGLPLSTLPFLVVLARIPARWGWLGVHVFFAVSGWCIAERLAKGHAQSETAGRFFRERIIRIYPVYWVVLAGTIAVRAASHSDSAGGLPLGLKGWLGAIFLIEPYFGLQGTYMVVAWTLVYEIGFYASSAAALVLARLPFFRGPVLFAIGSLICFAPWNFGLTPDPWFVLGYWPNFFAGASAWWAVRRLHRLSGYGVLVAMVGASLISRSYGNIERWTSLLTACTLAVCYGWDSRLASSRFVRVLMWVGGFSYSLYLVHYPLGTRLLLAAGRIWPSRSPFFTFCWLAVFVSMIAAGWLFCHWVEQPLERWRRRHTQQATPATVASPP